MIKLDLMVSQCENGEIKVGCERESWEERKIIPKLILLLFNSIFILLHN